MTVYFSAGSTVCVCVCGGGLVVVKQVSHLLLLPPALFNRGNPSGRWGREGGVGRRGGQQKRLLAVSSAFSRAQTTAKQTGERERE